MAGQERVVQADAEAEKLLEEDRQREVEQRLPQIAGEDQSATGIRTAHRRHLKENLSFLIHQ